MVGVFRDNSVDNFVLQWSFSRQMRRQTDIPRAESALKSRVHSKQVYCQTFPLPFRLYFYSWPNRPGPLDNFWNRLGRYLLDLVIKAVENMQGTREIADALSRIYIVSCGGFQSDCYYGVSESLTSSLTQLFKLLSCDSFKLINILNLPFCLKRTCACLLIVRLFFFFCVFALSPALPPSLSMCGSSTLLFFLPMPNRRWFFRTFVVLL